MPTALVIAAHPDDGELGCGGYVLQLVEAGWTVHWVVTTNGAKGTADRAMPRERLIALRREEQAEACRRLGTEPPRMLGYEDGELAYSRELVGALVRAIRETRPLLVLTHDPTDFIIRDRFINHADHRATGAAALDAVYPAARDHLNFPEQVAEGLEPWRVREVLLWNTNQPNFEVEIGAQLERKVWALAAHGSQFGETEALARFAQERWRTGEGRYVERFRRVVLDF
ncbi:PIG-L deacetylase family protein [Tepidiforma thermophila]|jgi:LmbE family N-acetylglucosaminyl deacetylase|uniref:LmbE family N-acetylglucosaminyl deacetylase n=1 Tax=Tepidiforma thermophila (strain KCTC 52669 / CGMCC 1.13589 / G233) TaxID=2761530 RepID=A0A2A9HFA7_TEPT2|nr:PIG-L deacetylase family protein [Tepidiforma thermophila]PFG73695.1 LmbE family N-acetylglucosaminyl deacetylase [Tepidiforma thermophila]